MAVSRTGQMTECKWHDLFDTMTFIVLIYVSYSQWDSIKEVLQNGEHYCSAIDCLEMNDCFSVMV